MVKEFNYLTDSEGNIGSHNKKAIQFLEWLLFIEVPPLELTSTEFILSNKELDGEKV